jgi:hypothetical protein
VSRLHYCVNLKGIKFSLPSPHDDISVRVLVSIPPTYPISSPPQLQLLSRYVGAFGADSALFGSVLRTFISVNGVEWAPDTVCVFDGLQSVIERCTTWYEDRLSAEKAGELVRGDAKEQVNGQPVIPQLVEPPRSPSPDNVIAMNTLPEDLQLFTAEPITDRKSAFVGRACRITHPSQASLRL